MTFQEELKMYRENIKQADSMFTIGLNYFREFYKDMPIDSDKIIFERYLHLLSAAARKRAASRN